MAKQLQPPPLAAGGEPWAIFLDIDGTLVGFDDDPARVVLDGALLQIIDRVRRRADGALAILSGRVLSDIDELMRPLRLPAGAMHGHELRNAAGLITFRNPPPDLAADVELKTLSAVAELDGVKLERKNGVGFVLHFRSAPHMAQAAAKTAEAIALTTSGEYEVQHGDCVAELKPTGSSKGIALQWLMDEKPFCGRRPIVVGDDLTDEHAFAVASDLGGFGVVVGARTPTLARYRLPGPAAVREWLAQLAKESR